MQNTRTTPQILQDFGIAPSPQRTAVYAYLLAHRNHPSAEQIFHSLRETMPTISLTTVYSTLKLFTEKGAVRELLVEDREVKYDCDTTDHAHFKCMSCGKVFDIFPEENGNLVSSLPVPPNGFQIKEWHIFMKGLCPSCSKELH